MSAVTLRRHSDTRYRPPMDSLLDTIAGLPVHPLVVHAVVILVPLSAVGLLVCLLRGSLRDRFGILVVLGAFAGAGAAWVAQQSGERLAAHLGRPEDHARWGDRLVPVAAAFALTTLIWYAASARGRATAPVGQITGALAAVVGLAVIGLTVLVGHTGAKSAWAGRVTTPATSTSSSTSPTSSTSATSSSTSTSTSTTSPALTMAAVATHNQQSDCWAAIDGEVYDLTTWVGQHPGGASFIVQLCGTDATSAFHGQHGTQPEPNDRLQQFLIGPLAAG